MKPLVLAILFAGAVTTPVVADSLAVAHPVDVGAAMVALPDVHARRLDGPLNLDGVLSEPIWTGQGVPARFIQSDPVEAAEPSFPTEVHVLYDNSAVYVGARMRDAHPDSIVARLCRRDQGSRSDEFTLYLDPFHDRRSGYWFVISAAGTLRDGVLYNDGWDDDSWDGVWQGKAHIDSTGWTAEMRIPYSQLRFKKSEQYRWGINFRRTLARRNEQDMIAYTPRNESGFVSRFPDLVGIASVAPSRAIEIWPYVTGKGEFLQHDAADPFNDGSRSKGSAGGDLKAALGSKLTLNAAVNPDFGQVEVDPAVVNLSDVETFFPEKRPFFVEGSSNYDFGSGGANSYYGFNWPGPSFFYSRRIGRAPQFSNYASDYADVPNGTRILGAAKITGKIAGDWNVGLMQSLTAKEMALVDLGGARSKAEVEPLTSYSVLRGQREFHKGRQGLGTISTLTVRRFDDPALRSDLNKSALVVGLDGWTFLDKSQVWVVTGWSGMSNITGTQARVAALQRNSVHYLQRPDARNWRFDPNDSSFTGYAGRFAVNKQKGSVTFNSAVGFINPRFDTNDLGFISRADVVNAHVSTGYRWANPDHWKRNANVAAAVFGSTDFDGNLISPGLYLNGGVVLLNYWSFWPRASYNPPSINNRLTRGGPLTRSPSRWDCGIYMDTDGRKRLYYELDTGYIKSQSGAWDFYASPAVQWKPAPNVQVNFGPNFDRNHQNSQYVGSIADASATGTYGQSYVFSQLNQTTISASVRLNWAFTPNMSLQLYSQPLISSGNYFGYKRLARSRSYAFDPLGGGVPQYDAGTDKLDLDGPGGSDPYNPDFNVTSLQGNAILRWEYMPGSTLFLVWTQTRDGYENSGEFELGPAVDRLFGQRPQNIFLAKVTYYLNR